MTLEDLERAKIIAACISSAKHNLATYAEFEKACEIKISINDIGSMQKPIFIAGENKENIIAGLKKKELIRLEEYETKLIKL